MLQLQGKAVDGAFGFLLIKIMLHDLSQIPIILPPILLALSFHEMAHAWAANHLGDPTARFQGRLSMNPLVHLDPMGTLAIIFFSVGWAKPVPVDTRNLSNPRKDMFWISCAGPLSNLAQAAILGLLIRLIGREAVYMAWHSFQSGAAMPLSESLLVMLFFGFFINIVLAWFNLLPLPPLDGSKIVMRFLSPEATAAYLQFGRYGVFILLLLVFVFPAQFWAILGTPVNLTAILFGGIPAF
ncbi:site-2 protease family protein [Gemmatimonadota bacterium]